MEHLDHPSHPPSPPISVMPKWRVFAPSRLHHCFAGGGEGGGKLIVPFYSVPLGQSCIKIINDKLNVVATDRNSSDD